MCICVCAKTIYFKNVNYILYFCFVAYYFVLSVIVDNTTMDGYITFKLLNQLGRVEEPWHYK